MNNNFVDEQKILIQRVEELHNLTVDTCKALGGTYEENLDGAIAYFMLNNKHFKMTIAEVEII